MGRANDDHLKMVCGWNDICEQKRFKCSHNVFKSNREQKKKQDTQAHTFTKQDEIDQKIKCRLKLFGKTRLGKINNGKDDDELSKRTQIINCNNTKTRI